MFAEALTEIIRRLDEARSQGLVQHYALIGGFAVSAWGVPRATHDVDFAVALGSSDPIPLSTILQADFRQADPDDPLRGVFRTGITLKSHIVPIQLILLPATWEDIIFHGVVSLPVFDALVPVVSWQALVLLKLYAGGPQDLIDAQQIFAVRQPTQDEINGIDQLAQRVALLPALRRLIDHRS